jgi:hypothetical protein
LAVIHTEESKHAMSWFGVFKSAAEGGVVTVREAEQLDGMERTLGSPLLHLDSAGAAFGGAKLDIAVAEAAEEPATGAKRGQEVVSV